MLMRLNYVDVVVEERIHGIAPLLNMILSELDAISSNPSLDILF